jgi:hypothetical protein
MIRDQVQLLARARLAPHIQQPTVAQRDMLVAQVCYLIDPVRRHDCRCASVNELADSFQNRSRGVLIER